MKALRAIALLALPFAAVRGEADNALSHTRPVVIDDLALLDPGKLVSPAYLFDSVMTNGGNDSRGKYIPRNRGFVDLDKDGHEDVIISAPLSEFGRGGGSFWMYLWTNGNYRCIGEFGSHPGWIKVGQCKCPFSLSMPDLPIRQSNNPNNRIITPLRASRCSAHSPTRYGFLRGPTQILREKQK